jgi:hypothetical protein
MFCSYFHLAVLLRRSFAADSLTGSVGKQLFRELASLKRSNFIMMKMLFKQHVALKKREASMTGT